MKTIIFFDTETTGLPKFNLPSEDPSQPRVTQLAAELCIEETGEALASMSMLITPDGWEMEPEAAAVTGFTMDHLRKFGVPINLALIAFTEMWSHADLRCGHNEPFDMRMMRIEYMRDPTYSGLQMPNDGEVIPFADYWKKQPSFCTQTNSTKILNLPPTERMLAKKMKGPKSPNLREAYLHFTGKELDGAHNAMVDVLGCKDVYYGIKAHNAAA
jgi:DNA polymerase-3 subunit epsilon